MGRRRSGQQSNREAGAEEVGARGEGRPRGADEVTGAVGRGGTGPVVRPRTWAYRPCTSAMEPYTHHAPQDAAREHEGMYGKVREGIRLPPSGANEGSNSQLN
ncbi:hypothetical protein V6N13_007808 [Hibiscus sabdariffa]